ncbi:MAG: hypothetical protein RL033_1126 [Pseudomonadota bacterium]|jgi:hypothetical protein
MQRGGGAQATLRLGRAKKRDRGILGVSHPQFRADIGLERRDVPSALREGQQLVFHQTSPGTATSLGEKLSQGPLPKTLLGFAKTGWHDKPPARSRTRRVRCQAPALRVVSIERPCRTIAARAAAPLEIARALRSCAMRRACKRGPHGPDNACKCSCTSSRTALIIPPHDFSGPQRSARARSGRGG